MRKRITLVVFLAITLAATVTLTRAPREAPQSLQAADPLVGEMVFRQNCGVCHGVQGEGKDLAPALNPTGHAHHHPDWELYMIIAEGKAGFGQMPAWRGKLSDLEIRSVITSIKTLWAEDQRRFQDRINQVRPAPP